MANSIEKYPIRALTLGMNTETSEALLPETQVKLSMNMHFDQIGSVTRRLGIAKVGNTIESGKNILGVYNFRDSGVGTNNQLIAAVNASNDLTSVIQYYNGVSWSNILTGDTSNLKTRFATFLDRVIRVNGTDAMKCWDGNTGNAWETSGGPINPDDMAAYPVKYIEPFKARLYAAGNSTYPDRLFYSSIISAANTITWTPSTDYIDISSSDGDNITALKRYALHQLIFKKNFMYRYNGRAVDADPVINIGTYSHESVVEGKGGVYWHHPYGIFVYSGGMPEEISRPVDVWLRNMSSANYDDVVGWSDRDHIHEFIGDVTVDGIAWSNIVLRYTISSKVWTVYSYSVPFLTTANYISGTSITQVAGSNDGSIYTIDSGNSDEGSPISYNLRTRWYDFGSLSNTKVFSKLAIFTQNSQGSKLQWQFDNQERWEDVEELNKFVTIGKGKNIKGHRIRFQFSGSSTKAPAVFEGLELLEGINLGVID